MIKSKVQPTRPIRKVNVAAVGASGSAVAVVWLFSQFGLDMPLEVAVVISGLAVGAFTWISGYLIPSAADDFEVIPPPQ